MQVCQPYLKLQDKDNDKNEEVFKQQHGGQNFSKAPAGRKGQSQKAAPLPAWDSCAARDTSVSTQHGTTDPQSAVRTPGPGSGVLAVQAGVSVPVDSAFGHARGGGSVPDSHVP